MKKRKRVQPKKHRNGYGPYGMIGYFIWKYCNSWKTRIWYGECIY